MMAKGDFEKSAHAPAIRAERAEIVARDELGDEALHEIFGVVLAVPHAAGKRVKRTPIRRAQLGEGRTALRILRRPQTKNHAPSSLGKGVGHKDKSTEFNRLAAISRKLV